MRDDRKRYINVKAIADTGPTWAHGCKRCQFGLVSAPAPVPALPLYECRAGQMEEDMLSFCDCRAGFMSRQFLRKVYAKLSLSARQNVREHVLAARVPSVHFGVEVAQEATP